MASDASAVRSSKSRRRGRQARRDGALRGVRALLLSTGLAAALPAWAVDTALGGADDTLAGVGFQWRQTTADAVYGQGSSVVPGTAGHGTAWTGFYTQIRADYAVTANLAAALEAVHFQVGPSLRDLGARNADYVGAELKFGR